MRSLTFFLNLSVFLILVTSNQLQVEEEEVQHAHPHGRPLNVMKFSENEEIIVDNDALDELFLNDEVKGRKIVAVSIIGAFRKGKSFLMDYALRYMYANYKSVNFPNNPLSDKRNWIGEPEESLKGFTWRGGANRDTTGVVVWSDIFLHTNDKGEKLAIVLMDTQGLFDTSTSPTDNSRIFALGTLISSIQIFNLNDVIQENQLEYLQMATDFAKFAMERNRAKDRRAKTFKPFQNLFFLMRDWQNNDDFEYGQSGGAQYLAQVLAIQDNQPEPLRQVRKFIKNSFEKTQCFLMPHPGLQVVNNNLYDGRWKELDEEFVLQLKDFLNLLLQPRSLIKKKVLNVEVDGSDYLEYIKAYFEAFQSEDVPRVETIHGITVRKQYDIMMTDGISQYKSFLNPVDFKVDNQWKEFKQFVSEMSENHNNAIAETMKAFRAKRKLGNEEDEKKYENQLKIQIETVFNEWKAKEIDSYGSIKKVEDEKEKELAELERKKQEELLIAKELAAIEKARLEEEHFNKTLELNGTIDEIKLQTQAEISNLVFKNEEFRKEAEKKREEMLLAQAEEKKRIENEAKLAQEQFQNELNAVQEELRRKEVEAQKAIDDKKEQRLEELKIQAEQRKMEFDLQMQREDKKAQALADQRRFDREQAAEERKIRDEATREERREREKAEQAQRAADREFQQQMMEARREAERKEREDKDRRDQQWQQMMAAMNKPPPPPPSRGFNLWGCIGSLFSSC